MPVSADARAVDHILERLTLDPKLAYFMGFGTESFHKLTEAYAERAGIDQKGAEKIWLDRMKLCFKPISRGDDGRCPSCGEMSSLGAFIDAVDEAGE
ncbi:hypothetical protein [Rhodomicrobium vannielii]|uniref:hypothetical protein n=1 Tax=Rhodomicrobium vannielii TaxID=1069 RepID=UPI001AEDF152|nr:hypothetical protein [Rhodomicrobium vannielii]